MEVTRTQHIEAPPERVFRALVEPAILAQWFCDTAQVEPRAGGVYAFGGPRAYGGDAVGRIVRYEPPGALAYVWPLAGSETTVTFELRPAGGATDVVMTHAGVASLPLDSDNPKEYLDAAWAVLLRQLATLLAGRPVPRYDFTASPRAVVELEIEIAAPVERVWEKLTIPSELNRWVARDAAVELQVGGRYSYGWEAEHTGEYGPQRITALEPPHLLAFSWVSKSVLGTVTWTLDPTPGGTLVRVLHEGLPERPGLLRDYHVGWWDYLASLREAARG